jgi:beta-galactosidase
MGNFQFDIRDGVLHIDNQPTVLVSADYPYFRDKPANWADRLDKLQGMGMRVVSCYIPWRHHQPSIDTPADFDGHTVENRNLRRFLNDCQRANLWVIAKPGPFIHAELNYGGLPDWVCPAQNAAIEPFLRANHEPVVWPGRVAEDGSHENWPLPAPLDPVFYSYTEAWLHTVGAEIIAPYAFPAGPIILAQIGNEGFYSDGQRGPYAYDFSQSGLAFFRRCLRETYQDLDTYNARHNTGYADWEQILPPRQWNLPDSLNGLLSYIDWGEFQCKYMGEVFRLWKEALGTDLPALININPPMDAPNGEDAWLMRVQPERWPAVHYGYTNWIGDVSRNTFARDRYLLMTKRATGINLEENWAFSKLYEPSYEDSCTSFHQTLLAFAGGAAGFNVYTGVGTGHWDTDLDNMHDPPYPDTPPISAEGEVTPKAKVVEWLSRFWDRHGADFLACVPRSRTAWGLYLPYAYIAAWYESEDTSPDLPQCGRSLGLFQAHMADLCADYAVVNLHTASQEQLAQYARLVMHAATFMDRSIQQKLAAYIDRGGKLALLGELPSLDDHFEPTDTLHSRSHSVTRLTADTLKEWLAENKRPLRLEGRGTIWVRVHPDHERLYVIVLVPADITGPVCFELEFFGKKHRLEIHCAAGGGAIMRIENDAVTDAIVKGVNYFLNDIRIPGIILDDQTIMMNESGDLFFAGAMPASAKS